MVVVYVFDTDGGLTGFDSN
uniref:Uncharacterized protein n=1 Tax=Arundo donax TaxID=35708 RepID=A0A0A8Y7U3_ARUDO